MPELLFSILSLFVLAVVFVIPPLMLVIVGVVIVYGRRQVKQRRDALAAVARQMGWGFDPERDSNWRERYPQFRWFTTGNSRYAYNRLWGTLSMNGHDLWCTMGDYTYTVSSGSGDDRSTTTYRFSFLVVELPYSSVPHLAVRREGAFDGVAALLGFNDIDFESEQFSRQFHVKSSDRRFAYDLIDPQMMEFLLDEPPPMFEMERNVLCARSSRGCWQPEEFAGQVDWCGRLLEKWPRHLVAELQDRETRS